MIFVNFVFIVVVSFCLGFVVLAFFDSSLLNCHFWPFTGVLRKIFGSLTREVWEFLHTPRIARMTRIGSWLASAAADPLQLDADWACPARALAVHPIQVIRG